MDRPAPLRLGMDALRAWAVFGGIDGFRLDLATTLGRRETGFDPEAPLLTAIEQDPILSGCVMIAEPWDIGPGGYQLGSFPAGWGEWNDRFRDSARRFWRGDANMLGDFTTRFAGSADVFSRRPLTRGVNYITAHDGFTLADLVSYETKRNYANGEDNRDGTSDNSSWNNGAEGPSSDAATVAARTRDARALLATLLLSRGTPMLSMGDEVGRTQSGNNNAYAQDNASAWVDWASADLALAEFTATVIALRRDLAPLFDGSPLRGQSVDDTVIPDVTWLSVDGQPIDWNRPDNHTLTAVLFARGVRAALIFHTASMPAAFMLPPSRHGQEWSRELDSAGTGTANTVAPRSVTVFREIPASQPSPNQPLPTSIRIPAPTDADLDHLAELAGINPIWWDVDGGFHKVGIDTKRTLLAAMRLPAATVADFNDSLARLNRQPALPPAVTARIDSAIPIRLGQPHPAWVTLLREDGSVERFLVHSGGVVLPPQPLGRYRVLNEDQPDQVCHLTVAPAGCYLPPALASGQHRFGIAAHLYALRSRGDQGIGDFTTLTRFAAEAARAGASVVGLNPLHALFPHDRSRASPYQPSDRHFLDPIYIDVSSLPGADALPADASNAVDYDTVWQHKRAVLRAAFDPAQPIAIPEALRRFAIFETITETLGTPDWSAWPAELRHPDSSGVAAFADQHTDTVRFHAHLQILADQQLAAAAKNALSIGFYRDLAVGAAPDGAEAWSAQDNLMQGVSVGAPPDPFSAQGQVWSLPPPDPVAMRRDGFAALNDLLAANMRHAGALRIDHVMGLRRLFVIPDGAHAADGAYVTYPMEDLLAQVALQSHRAQCLVVGEDLGTVPEGMTEALAASNILSYSVLWFQRRDGQIRPPAEWCRLATACVSTHDLPTLAGWWNGADIAEKRALSLLDDPNAEAARATEKAALIALLRTEDLLSDDVDPSQPMPDSVAAAIHAFVSATPALLALVQADDLAGETTAVNLPGTDRERPNWRRRLSCDVSELCRTPLAQAILAAMQARRSDQ
jgi:4-alpha-glucanotransferase